ncbi:heterokaryon incompatibility protein-domain-containing protein [Xylaria bambusicola]|uniref:heterokaryon incompatibility protein-domain-containing protein n=1 Tax=Xylaria bambusicola TaxID=326684 RepID=UPI00200780E7|nr:heterokaryon incompatibility protein-domain-containing protein [Xylaria bambusicola]KAI0520865.1 heterokaryon incompatibility protein-domain-containing protein [Xylaria bambusicola]
MDILTRLWTFERSTDKVDGQPYCRKCVALLGSAQGLDDLCSETGFVHHSKADCLKSAQNGCDLCEFIFQRGWVPYSGTAPHPSARSSRDGNHALQLHFFAVKMEDYDPSYRPFFENYKPHSIKGTEMLIGRIRQKGWYTVIDFVPLASRDDPAAEIFPKRPFSNTFMTDDIMNDIVNWIQTCLSSKGHDGCLYDGKPQLPTRVIDVGTPESNSIKIHTTDEGESDDYVTLSYCWGGPQPLTANSNTVVQLINGVHESTLPPTVRDAVLTTRRFGFRYLWVDALCIIQDNEDDKRREIGKMGQIYRNSTVTIVAAHSRSAMGGFLKPELGRTQTPSFPMAVKIPGSDTNGQVTLTFALSSISTIQPLATRGWAFQEAMLSMRLVTFSEFEVYCECNRKPATLILNSGSRRHLSSPMRHGGRLYAPDGRLSNQLQQAHQDHGPGWMDSDFLVNSWEMIVTQFTRRSLTFPDDRLPGVQGLASELLQHLSPDVGGDYVAGVFTNCLPRLLLWSRSNVSGPLDWPEGEEDAQPRQMIQTERSKRAPTWSWASVDYPILYFTDEWDTYDCTVSVVQGLSSLGAEEVAQVSMLDQAGLTILEIESELLYRNRHDFEDDRTSGKIRAIMDIEANGPIYPEEGVWYLFLSKNIGPEEWAPSQSGPTAKGSLRCWYDSGIIVQKRKEGLYSRIGYFRRDYEDDSKSEELLCARQRIHLV